MIEEPATVAYCASCGEEVIPGAVYCERCRAERRKAQAEPRRRAVVNTLIDRTANQQGSSASFSRLAVFFVLIALLLITLMVVFFLLR